MKETIEDFTLIVPIRERHYNIPKVIQFYKDLECEKIMIDSSKKEYEDKKDLLDAGFKYFHFPEYHFYDKMFILFEEVIETSYVLNAPDDDYFNVSTIKECVDFLTQNKDYSICDGVYLEMLKRTKKDIIKKKGKVFLRNKYSGALMDQGTYSLEDTKERFLKVFDEKCYFPRNHSVVRSDVYRSIVGFIKENIDTISLKATDRIFTTICALSGKIQNLPLLYCIRKGGSDRLVYNAQIKKKINLDAMGLSLIDEILIQILNITSSIEIFSNEEMRKIILATRKKLKQTGNINKIKKQNELLIEDVFRIMWDEKPK